MAQPFRFIHCSDLHLGAPFMSLASIGKYGDDMIVQATYRAFEKIIDTALEERVDAVLIAGDIYNSADHNLEAQVRFVRQLERLSEKKIPVFIVHGNHDPLSSWSAKIPMPEGVHIFSGKTVERVPLKVRDKEVAAIYGISHDEKGIKEDLAKGFKPSEKDVYSIGLLHCTVGGTEFQHEYAPTTLDVLRDVGMDYWALGHIHKRQVLCTNPHIVYCGNPQGLSRREKGSKGCYLVSVSATGHTELTFVETDAIAFDEGRIDISHLQTVEDLEEMIRHKKQMVANKYKHAALLSLTLEGCGPLAQACRNEETRAHWLTNAKEEERGKFNFVIPYEMNDATALAIDLEARRLLPDMLGDYLSAYDGTAQLEGDSLKEALRRIVAERPEVKRLGSYGAMLTDELLEKAFRKAELEGAFRLAGDKDEE